MVWCFVVDGVDGVSGVCPKKPTMGPRQIAGGRWWWMGQTPLQERTVGTEWSHPVNRPVQLFQLLSLCVLSKLFCKHKHVTNT